MAKMASENWRTILCTVFTKSVINPQGFALACQLDKNLGADVDYMKMRRVEDFRAARVLNVTEVLHLNFAEAPHRGYESAPELFAGLKKADEIWQPVAEYLALLNEIHQPQIIFAPQGLGDHCDHGQTIRATRATFAREQINWYRDTPYAIRQPSAMPFGEIPALHDEFGRDISDCLEAKIEACAQYSTQINFQFGGAEQLKTKLEDFHRAEAERLDASAAAVESFLRG